MFKCKVDGCDVTKHKAKGYCRLHYDRVRMRGTTSAREYMRQPEKCRMHGCDGETVAKGLCSKHLQRKYKHGDPSVYKHSKPYGSGTDWFVGKDGYVMRRASPNDACHPNYNGYIYQHRDVMSRIVGRPLTSDESVHHKNGDRSDNRPENLELWGKGQPAGQRVQDKVAWCAAYLSDHHEDAVILDPDLEVALQGLAAKLQMRYG